MKPLTIPKGMFKTAEEVNAFSKAVEAIRTITEHNFNKKAYRVITKQFFDGDETTDLYNSAIVFIKRNDPKIKLKTEYEFDNWESRKFWLCFNSKEGKKIVESDYDFDDIDDLIAFDSLGLIQ